MLRAALLTCLSAVLPITVSAAIPLPDVTAGSGVNVHFTDAKPGELEMLAAAGFRHVRMDFTWGSTEKQKGVYDFSAYDRLAAALEKHGLKGYFILDYANKLYEPERAIRTPEGRAAFSEWAAAAVTHFKGKGICWEIWNEPNGGFWHPHADVKEYVLLALEASKAIRTAQPGEYLCGPATSTIDMGFLEGCFKAGLLEYWDGVSVHPYRQGGPETAEIEYRALSDLIAKYAPAGRKVDILSGEWGYSAAWVNHDADTQGRMLARQWMVNAACGVPMSIWYDWHDDGPDPKEPEHHFGTVKLQYFKDRDPVYDPKPAYHAAKTFNTLLKGARLAGRPSLGDIDHRAMLFERDGRQILAAWSTLPGSHEVELPADDGVFRATSHVGEALPDVRAAGGRLALTVTEAPVYIDLGGVNRKLAAAPQALLMKLSVVPCTGRDLVVKIENFSGRAFTAVLTLDGVKGLSPETVGRQAVVPAENGVTDAVLRLKEVPAEGYEVGLQLEVDGARVGTVKPRLFSPPDDAALAEARPGPEGDPKVGGTFSLTSGEAPEKSPAGDGRIMRLDYDFQPGWKYVSVFPSSGAPGKPLQGRGDGAEISSVIFGMWLYGNESSLAPRVRVRDALGRVWQPSGPAIKWKGWKYIEMRLDENTAHWGGKEKGPRGPQFPLKWESLFLLDNTARTAAKGSIWFTMPVLILE